MKQVNYVPEVRVGAIGRISVAYQRTVKVFSEDRFCHIGGTVLVDMKKGKVFIPCEPYIMPHAVTAP